MTARVSRLESFRRMLLGWQDEAALVRDLHGQPDPPSWQMEAGTAFHELLASPEVQPTRPAMCERKTGKGNVHDSEALAEAAAYLMRLKTREPIQAFRCGTCKRWHLGKPTDHEEDLGRLERNGWSFKAADWRRVRDHQGPGLREVRSYQQVGPLLVEGTCDHIRGRVIRDTKCKFSPVDARAYEVSLQWRFYLHLHDADCFAYDLLSFREDNRRLELLDITTVRFWRYPGLEDDCREWAGRFHEWAECVRGRAAA